MERKSRRVAARAIRVLTHSTKASGVSQQAKLVARGMAEALDYDTNFERLAEMIIEQSGMITDMKDAESAAAREVAKVIAPAIKRQYR